MPKAPAAHIEPADELLISLLKLLKCELKVLRKKSDFVVYCHCGAGWIIPRPKNGHNVPIGWLLNPIRHVVFEHDKKGQQW
ncbi:MAG TPA: hypothetical protein VFE58_09060 [Tepidisphaeraceae bacterium]|jgi:hypothetical protein|nr:hypothetical protein [Tepidisphaeraceae bacterium]